MKSCGITAVVFDLGKVLLDFDYSIAANAIAARGRLTAEEVIGCFMRTPLLARYESGLMSSAEFFSETCTLTGYSGTLEEFAACFGDIFVEIKPMIELHASLRTAGIPTFVFSNTNDFAVRFIRRRFPFFSNFQGYILSYEHGVMKPDPGLYEVVERTTGCKGVELLYLDDRPENVEAGAARGWRTILHQDSVTSLSQVESLGLLPNRGAPSHCS